MRLRLAPIGLALLALAAPAVAAGAPKPPRIGRTAVVKALSGTVLVGPGAKHLARLRGARSVKIGTTVDATHGKLRLTTAAGGSRIQAGTFNGGQWTIQQKRSSALTELRLAGADGCGNAKPGDVHSARSSKRSLFGRAHGRFRTRGRHSSATIRGTVWSTEDLCNGATLTRAFDGGDVEAKNDSGAQQDLKPGESSEDYCSDRGYPGVSDLYCMSLYSIPKDDVFGAAIVTYDPGTLGNNPKGTPAPRDVDMCVKNPQGAEQCRNYALEDLGNGSWIQSDGCGPVSGPGDYSIRWRLGGADLPVPLTYHSTHQGAGIGCIKRPPGEPPPAKTRG
jgi:hypothetical protein